jgi:hypothetical protein
MLNSSLYTHIGEKVMPEYLVVAEMQWDYGRPIRKKFQVSASSEKEAIKKVVVKKLHEEWNEEEFSQLQEGVYELIDRWVFEVFPISKTRRRKR